MRNPEDFSDSALKKAIDLLAPWEITLLLATSENHFRDRVLSMVLVPEERENIKIMLKHLGRVRVSDIEKIVSKVMEYAERE